MKALSIEEIKNKKDEEWLFIVDLKNEKESSYYKFNRVERGFIVFHEQDGSFCPKCFLIEDYCKTWVAYNNKEQAECKGEFVMLPCQIHDVGYFVDTENKMIVEADVKEILIHNYTKKFATIQITFEQLEGRVLYNDFCKQMCLSEIYWDKEQAEEKLKELKKYD